MADPSHRCELCRHPVEAEDVIPHLRRFHGWDEAEDWPDEIVEVAA